METESVDPRLAAQVDDGASFTRLNKLYLDRNPIGDEGAEALASVRNGT